MVAPNPEISPFDASVPTSGLQSTSQPRLAFSHQAHLWAPAPFFTPAHSTAHELEDNPGSVLGTPTPSKAQRVTAKNPVYGLVEGAKRGNIKLSMQYFALS